ncbi:membrane protein insertion efficiency factor YidD [Candidatus Poriferisodalis sp.]|uniref:membrane protein insertion efficiency factor YidD n=1 Tax=Candidatus Poriferisodalis sp. TaxID=3101277 RepID=UPI003B0119A9
MKPSPLARVGVAAVRFYRAFPRSRPPSCRFDPTCSQYTLDALRIWGAVRGGWLATRRLCRCHPWGGWGYDPVPARVVSTQESDPESDPVAEISEHACST